MIASEHSGKVQAPSSPHDENLSNPVAPPAYRQAMATPRRFKPTDAFVDESVRGQRYLMGCVLIEARHLAGVRADVDALVLTGGRVHFHAESAGRRRSILAEFAGYPLAAFVVACHRSHGISQFRARALCVAAIVDRLQHLAVPHLVIESRHDDREDHVAISRARRSEPSLVWEHRPGAEEPLLWIADGITWAVGAGPGWRELIRPILVEVIELRP